MKEKSDELSFEEKLALIDGSKELEPRRRIFRAFTDEEKERFYDLWRADYTARDDSGIRKIFEGTLEDYLASRMDLIPPEVFEEIMFHPMNKQKPDTE
jgi:hypothetical protein